MNDDGRILAAGTLLWRDARRLELCLVHRHRYDDWCLPKGKLDPGERFVEAALRETFEETGHRAALDEFAGELLYAVRGREKSVLYWNVVDLDGTPSGEPDPDEVAELRWLPVAEALRCMSYEGERRILADNAPTPG